METNETSLDETHNITEEKMQELIEIKKKIVESKKKFRSIEQSRIEALRKKRITIANIRAFTAYKRAFQDAGIDFRNLKDFANVLSVIGELDSNSEMIIDEMKKTGALEFRKQCLEKQCDEAEKNLEIYKKEEEDRKKYAGSYGLAMDLVNKTLVAGVTEDEITNLFITIMNNKYHHYSFTELQTDIDTYGGIKSAIFKIKRDLQKLIAEKDNLITSRQLLDFY